MAAQVALRRQQAQVWINWQSITNEMLLLLRHCASG
jgi:hypothetical protein